MSLAWLVWLALDLNVALSPPPLEIALTLQPVVDRPQAPHTAEFQPTVTYRNRGKSALKLLLAYGCDQTGFHSLVVDSAVLTLTERWPPCKAWFARSADHVLRPGETFTITHPTFTTSSGTHTVSVRYTVPARDDCPDCRRQIDKCGKDCNAAIWRGTVETPPLPLTVP